MVQVLPAYNPWESVNQAVTSGYEAFKARHDENAIQSAMSGLNPNASAREILDAITNANTYSPKAKQQVLENYLGVEKLEEARRQGKDNADYKRMERDINLSKDRKVAEQRDRDLAIKEKKIEIEGLKLKERDEDKKRNLELKETKNNIALDKEAAKQKEAEDKEATKQGMITSLDLPDEDKELLRGATYSVAEKLFTKQITPKDAKPSKAEEFYSKELAKELHKIQQELPIAEADLKTLDKIDAIIEERAKNPVLSKIGAWLGSAQAKELNALALPFIKNITKVLAPVGAIIKAKMDEAKDKVFIQASDMPWQQKGKSKALRYMYNTSIDRMKKREKDIIDSDFSIPKSKIEKFDKETAGMIDAILSTTPGVELSKENIPEGLPDPKKENGNIIDTPNGSYYSNGKAWMIYQE